MKHAIGIFLALVFFSISASAQKGAEIAFEKTFLNLGNLSQSEKAVGTFTFTNNGDQELLIKNVTSSSGALLTTWSRDPIAPKDTGVIRINYDPVREGPFNKSINVTSNSKSGDVVLRIKGNVKPETKP